MNIKKIDKKTSIKLYIAIPATILLLLLFLAFRNSMANHKHFANQKGWTSFQTDNTKRFFNEIFINGKNKFIQLIISPQAIKKELKNAEISYFELITSQTNLHQLNANLPKSGRIYADAQLINSNSDKEKVRFKYRGDKFYHWGFQKKSIKIKKNNGQIVNLINPKEINFIATKIAFDFAEKLKLYTPETKFTGLFINDKFQGIFLETQEIDSLFANQQKPPFTVIFQGENTPPRQKSGPNLTKDSNKWTINGGFSSKKEIGSLLHNIDQNNFKQLAQQIDFDYWAKFYSFVSIIQNSHFDNTHNWFLGSYNQKLYPIIWDPVGWVMSYEYGNGVEEMKSSFSQTFRKNVYFNQLFVQNLWLTINDKNIINELFNNINTKQKKLTKILDNDLYKGSIFRNPKGERAFQSTEDINEEIEKLKETIQDRLNFISQTITDSSVEFYTDPKTNYTYIRYSGISNATIENYTKNIEVFNNGKFIIPPKTLPHLFSGRSISQDIHPYANTCPTTFRIKNITSFSVKNQLTKKPIKLKKVDDFKIIDCQIDFTQLTSTTPHQPGPSTDYPRFEINFPTINPADYFQIEEKSNEKVSINTATNNYSDVEFKKGGFEEKINLDFGNSKYFGRKKMDLYPADIEYSNLPLSTDIAKLVNLPQPKIELISLYSNNFYIGQYLLVEDPKNKSFFETNGLTFDTDIYRLIGNNPTEEKGWQKISTDPRVKNKDKRTLKQLLRALDTPQKLNQLIDWQNFDNFNSYLKQTGNQFPKYFLYFDNTLGRFKFIPQEHVLYKSSEDFTVNDSLLSAIRRKSSTPPSFNHPIFSPETEPDSYVIRAGDYRIKKDIIIPAGLHITIQPGTTLKLDPKVSILSFSAIQAIGTANLPIKITKSKDTPFGVFAIIGTVADKSTLDFVEINGGSEAFINRIYLSGQFSTYHADIDIKNSAFKNAQADDGLNIKYAHTLINNSHFENNSADAIDLDFVTGLVDGNTFDNNGNDAIDLSGSTVSLTNNTIKNSGDKGISIGENSQPRKISHNLLDSCNIGLEIKDSSIATITNNTIQNNNIGINAYQKKEFFGPAQLSSYQTIFKNNLTNTDYQNNSTITIH